MDILFLIQITVFLLFLTNKTVPIKLLWCNMYEVQLRDKHSYVIQTNFKRVSYDDLATHLKHFPGLRALGSFPHTYQAVET